MARIARPAEYITVMNGSQAISVEVIRMRRKTCSISVLDDARVVLKCPPSMTGRQIDRFLGAKHDWLVKHYTEICSRMDAYRDVMDFKAVLVDGKPRPLVSGPKPCIYEDRVEVRCVEDIGPLFIKTYGKQLEDFARELAARFSVSPKSITVKGYKSRWGCCDADGNIRLNYALMMLTRDEQALVIIHEFCHLFYMNHSGNFHALLDKWYPENRRVQKRLNAYSFLLRLYN